MMRAMHPIALLLALCMSVAPTNVRAESQGNDKRGIQDPFGDPTNFEFSDDEREDKEFFHLGRYVMIALDLGAGVFTGGLGTTNGPGVYTGGRLVYFMDKSLAMEVGGHYANHLDSIILSTTRQMAINTDLVDIGAGFRYYFDTKNAPRAMTIANPFLCFGADIMLRTQTVVQMLGTITPPASPNTTAFGANVGGGAEFLIYQTHVYLGLDIRYHLMFWPDKDDTLGGAVNPGSRDGGYISTMGTLSYSF